MKQIAQWVRQGDHQKPTSNPATCSLGDPEINAIESGPAMDVTASPKMKTWGRVRAHNWPSFS